VNVDPKDKVESQERRVHREEKENQVFKEEKERRAKRGSKVIKVFLAAVDFQDQWEALVHLVCEGLKVPKGLRELKV